MNYLKLLCSMLPLVEADDGEAQACLPPASSKSLILNLSPYLYGEWSQYYKQAIQESRDGHRE